MRRFPRGGGGSGGEGRVEKRKHEDQWQRHKPRQGSRKPEGDGGFLDVRHVARAIDECAEHEFRGICEG